MKSKLLRLVVMLLLAAGLVLALGYRDALNPSELEAWVKQAGLLGPLLFMLCYALGTVLFVPGSVLTLAGGALFGPLLGVLYNLTGATAGAALAFLIARYLAANWVEQKAGGKLKQLKEGVESEGWRFVGKTQ